jgi:hypothetical protein
MATYHEIQKYVLLRHRFIPKPCWIADVKEQHGLTTRIAANRLNSSSRKVPCPPTKKSAIEDALHHFDMI